MNYKEFILDLYKKGCTPNYIANLMLKKLKKRNNIATKTQALNFVETTILEFYASQKA